MQVNIIKVAEVNISNAIKDQSDSAATEKSLQKQWTRKLSEAQKKLAQGEGALAASLDPSNMQYLPISLFSSLRTQKVKCTAQEVYAYS